MLIEPLGNVPMVTKLRGKYDSFILRATLGVKPFEHIGVSVGRCRSAHVDVTNSSIKETFP